MILQALFWYHWVIIGVGILLLGGLIFSIILTMYIAKQVYEHTLVKRTPDSWGRVCSAPENEEQVEMWNRGLEWGKENAKYKKEVEITSKDGLKLVGEFFDFGKEKTAIILSGRCECCWYGYYYAFPYHEAGYNILVIDGRGHGNSEGKYSTAGILESEDVVGWMKLLKEKYNQKGFIFHCICIGSATGTLAAQTEFGQQYVEKLILDGAYISFIESYKRHYIDKGHALFPVFYEIWIWFRFCTGVSVRKSNPLKIIPHLNQPILFIYSKEDKYSLPAKTQLLIDACKGEKVVKAFDKGAHSHVRINNEKEYDETIVSFVK